MPIQYLAIDPPAAMGPAKTITSAIWQKVVDDASLHQNALAVYYLNSTGVALVAGDVVVIDDAADGEVLTTTTPGDARKVAVVQDPTINIGAPGWFAIHGHVPALHVDATIGRQVALQTSATAKTAKSGAGNAFGVTLTGRTGAGLVEAFIHNAGASSAHVIKDLLATYAQRTNLIFGDGLIVEDLPGSDAQRISSGFPTGDPGATHGPVSFHVTGTTLVHGVIAAPGGGFSIFVTRIKMVQANATPSLLSIFDHAGVHTEVNPAPGVAGWGIVDAFDPPWKIGDNVELDYQQSALGDIYVSINFYVKAV